MFTLQTPRIIPSRPAEPHNPHRMTKLRTPAFAGVTNLELFRHESKWDSGRWPGSCSCARQSSPVRARLHENQPECRVRFKLMWNYPEIRGLHQPPLCSRTGSADVLVG